MTDVASMTRPTASGAKWPGPYLQSKTLARLEQKDTLAEFGAVKLLAKKIGKKGFKKMKKKISLIIRLIFL